MNWISVEELLLIHERVIAETGGARGIANPGALESALARPFTSVGGVEPFFWAVARGEKEPDAIAEWLRTHIEPWETRHGTS